MCKCGIYINDVLSLSHIMQLIKTIKIAYTITQYEN